MKMLLEEKKRIALWMNVFIEKKYLHNTGFCIENEIGCLIEFDPTEEQEQFEDMLENLNSMDSKKVQDILMDKFPEGGIFEGLKYDFRFSYLWVSNHKYDVVQAILEVV